MPLKKACVIKKISISNATSLQSDSDIALFLENAGKLLGKDGRFIIRLSAIPQENCVLAEGESEESCSKCIDEFISLLIEKGYKNQ